jgi:hypothetical protein
MLESIREYALERLAAAGDETSVRMRHAEYFLAFTAAREARTMLGESTELWFQEIEAEYDNVRVALAWGLDHHPELALRLVGVLGLFWLASSHVTEGRAWAERALAIAASESAVTRAKALLTAALLANGQSDRRAAAEAFGESLRLARQTDDSSLLASVLFWAGQERLERGDSAGAKERLLEAMILGRDACDDQVLNDASLFLAVTEVADGNYELGRKALEDLLVRPGATRGLLGFSARYYLAGLALREGDILRARASLADAASSGWREMAPMFVAHMEDMVGRIEVAEGNGEAARELFDRNLRTFIELGTPICAGHTLEGFARLALLNGRPQRAAQLLGAIATLSEALGTAMMPIERALCERTEQDARAGLDDPAFEAAWQRGRAMSLEQAVKLARSSAEAST